MKTTLLFVTALMLSFASFSQSIPELVFKNPVLIQGTAGQDGAEYKFSNVVTGSNAIDAIVTIKGRSASDVILKNIDSSGIGWEKAFQPTLGVVNVGANREWWIEFRIEFVKAGTNSKKTIDTFYVTGLDIDGDNGHLNEWAEMEKAKQLQTAPVTSLSTSLLSSVVNLADLDLDGNDYRINGPKNNYSNIDTGSSQVMATYKYAQKDKIDFKIGGKTDATGGTSGEAGLRLNSLWFKQFSMSSSITTLPVKLVSFNAMLNNNKVDLTWITASEKNVSHFVIEKSTDGKNYTDAGIVFAYGNTSENVNYSFSDNNINTSVAGVTYYRLRSVDIDAKSELSNVRVIRIGKQSEQTITILTYPNPAGNELKITIPNNWQGKKVSYEVLNNNGRIIIKTEPGNSSQTETINVSSLSPGFYLARVSCNGETALQKIIKQ